MATDTVPYEVLGTEEGRKIFIKDTIDLNNCVCIIPENVSLVFRGGYLKNGTLVGNNTKLKSSSQCFSRIRIKGTWNVPVINADLFDDLSYDNALKDVMALSDSSIRNKIYIGEGKYQVTAYKNGDVCIPVSSNTEIQIDGDIWLTPNGYRNSYIIQATGSNIIIHGKGAIIGDKHTHTGTSGEWGMGIDVEDAHHVTIAGLTIKDCWGDCIYVGSNSTDIKIEKCKLDHGRRQGISVTSANGLLIRDCFITNVSGTAPEYAIDIEPNKNETVDNVQIENISVNNCNGGILVYGKASNAKIGKVLIKNCSIVGARKNPIFLVRCSTAKVEKCIMKHCLRKKPIITVEVGLATLHDNKTEL
jgi:hypothetical protein